MFAFKVYLPFQMKNSFKQKKVINCYPLLVELSQKLINLNYSRLEPKWYDFYLNNSNSNFFIFSLIILIIISCMKWRFN